MAGKIALHAKLALGGRKFPFAKHLGRTFLQPMSESPLGDELKARLLADADNLDFAFKIADGDLTPEFYTRLAKAFQERDLVRVRLLATARPKRAGHIGHLVKHGHCAYVGMLERDALLYRPKGAAAAKG